MAVKHIVINNKKYSTENGSRLTDCCAAYSTYCDDDLSCKVCYESVEVGEGDGSERVSMPEIETAVAEQSRADND